MLSLATVLLGSGLVLRANAFVLPFRSPTSCCSLLGAEFNGDTEPKVFSNTPLQATEYESLSTYWTPAARLNPTCIFTPTNTQDVARAVKLFTRKNCQFAIRSGGHSYNPGWAGITNGVLISLYGLNNISYDSIHGLASIGAGNRWTDVYGALLEHGVTVLGGRNSDLGVGGYLTGGGISYYSNDRGWATDNIFSVEIVLADGKIITASRHEHKELFRCIKGGSNNYGVITKFVLETVDASKPFNAFAIGYPATSNNDFISHAYDYCTGGSDADTKSHIIFAASISKVGGFANGLLGSYSDVFDAANPAPVLRPFFDGTVPNPAPGFLSANGTIKVATDILSIVQAPGTRYAMGTFSVYADIQLFHTLRGIWEEETTEELKDRPGFMTEFAFQPVGEKWLAASAAKGGNSFGIDRPLVMVWLQPRWDLASDDAMMVAYTDRVRVRCEQAAKTAGKFAKFRHLNYGGRNQRNEIIHSFGTANVLRMQLNKLQYDPLNVFGRLVPGGFKIPGF
ncbi:hypothetical protein TWF106_000761 [Orbilia oligospora]|uniref:FAD-binding PCMH-type domain-containing protein n=1 Tax=Orbilia oligospora TaxID=2813651 RepID=A0A7C8V6T1_ORBOL|nr:hypothetical protein TWF106_000761 [Orbilia oligospora]